MKLKLKAYVTYFRNIYTALFASLASWLFSSLLLDSYTRSYIENDIEMMSVFSRAFYTIMFPLVVILAAILVFYYFDNLDLFNKKDYFNAKNRTALISRPIYLISFAIAMLFSPLIFGNGYHMALSFFMPKISPFISRILSIATMAAVRLVQLYLLKDKWDMEIENPLFVEKTVFKRNRDMDQFKIHQLFWQPIGYCIVFSIAASFAGFYIFPMFMVIFNIIINPQMLLVSLGIPICILVAVFIVRILINARKRKILIRHLKNMEKEQIASVTTKGSKILSAAFTFLPFSAVVTDTNGKIYNCLIISCGKINAPMYFKPDEYMVEHGMHMRGGGLLSRGGSFGQVVDISKWGGKENPTNLVFGYRMSHKIKFPKIDGEKVLIVSPTPTTIFAVEGREFRSIDNGEDMKEYTIYTATGFYNHIERQQRKHNYDY